jgi:hypothetical protein
VSLHEGPGGAGLLFRFWQPRPTRETPRMP